MLRDNNESTTNDGITKKGAKSEDVPKSPKRKRTLPVRDILREEAVTPNFKVIGNLRFVVPYQFKFRVYAKKRWFDRSILEVFTSEFQAYTAEYYTAALKSGKLTVNDKIVPPGHALQDHDFITHCIHRHEPPILNQHIETIFEDENLLVVNKPASVPIHTTGRYQHNTLLKILELRVKYKLYTCHRIDRLTSGIVVLLKHSAVAKQYSALFFSQRVEKSYLALCAGKHPATRSCSEPVLRVCHKLGICRVDAAAGKPAHTDFVLLHYYPDTDRSLVLCKPKSGRMHQIRVHLAHHGHPIPNDPIYSRDNWAKKSTEAFSKELSDALFRSDNFKDKPREIRGVSDDGKDKLHEITGVSDDGKDKLHEITGVSDDGKDKLHEITEVSGDGKDKLHEITGVSDDGKDKLHEISGVSGDGKDKLHEIRGVSGDGIKASPDIQVTSDQDFLIGGAVYRPMPQLDYDGGCPECAVTRLVPHQEDMFIYLHAVRYELDNKVFVAPLPAWADQHLIPAQHRPYLGLG